MRRLVLAVALLLTFPLIRAVADGAEKNVHVAYGGKYILNDFCSITIKTEHPAIIFSAVNPFRRNTTTGKTQHFDQDVIVERLPDEQIRTIRPTIEIVGKQEYYRRRADADFDLFREGCLEEAKLWLSLKVKRLIGEYFGNAYGLYDGFPKADTAP